MRELLPKLRGLAALLLAAACNDGGTSPSTPQLNGQLIAYGATSGSTPMGLWVAEADGPNSRMVTPDTFVARTPAWSPDGASLAFVVVFRDRIEMQVMRADGTQRAPIVNGRTRNLDPAWSPDGQRLAFATGPAGAETLFVMNRDGTGLSVRAPSLWDDRGPAWSPDGTLIAFTSLRDPPVANTRWRRLFLMNADGTNVHRLAPAIDLVSVSWPSWSPDGTQLAFEARPPGAGQSDIYVITVATDAVRQLTSTTDDDRHPTWSPDGQRIAFTRQTSTTNRVVSVAVDGSGLREITTGSVFAIDPVFRPIR